MRKNERRAAHEKIPATAATFEADKLTKADELLLIMIHF